MIIVTVPAITTNRILDGVPIPAQQQQLTPCIDIRGCADLAMPADGCSLTHVEHAQWPMWFQCITAAGTYFISAVLFVVPQLLV